MIATEKRQTDIFVDYCALETAMKMDRWPLPHNEELFDELIGVSFLRTWTYIPCNEKYI